MNNISFKFSIFFLSILWLSSINPSHAEESLIDFSIPETDIISYSVRNSVEPALRSGNCEKAIQNTNKYIYEGSLFIHSEVGAIFWKSYLQEKGICIDKDQKAAFHLLESFSKKFSHLMFYRYAYFLENGIGTEVNLKQAYKFYKLALLATPNYVKEKNTLHYYQTELAYLTSHTNMSDLQKGAFKDTQRISSETDPTISLGIAKIFEDMGADQIAIKWLDHSRKLGSKEASLKMVQTILDRKFWYGIPYSKQDVLQFLEKLLLEKHKPAFVYVKKEIADGNIIVNSEETATYIQDYSSATNNPNPSSLALSLP